MQGAKDDTNRYKLVLSDGTYMQLAILPSKYADLIDSDSLKIGYIVLLTSYTCRYVWNTRTIIILSLQIKQSDCQFFGKPTYLFKEQKPKILGQETPSSSKRSLQFVIALPSPQRYFNGKVVNMTSTTTLHINPAFPEAEPLMLRGRLPLHSHDFSSGFTHIDGRYTRMTIESIRERMSVKPEIIQTTIVVVLRFVNVSDNNFCYDACPLKVNEYNYSYLLPMKLQDATGTAWATSFDEVGIDLIKKIAKELYILQNDVTTTQTPYVVINTLVSHRYMFTLLVSTNTYNFEPKMKVTISKIYVVDYKAEYNALLAEIAHLSG
ncbi:hypothetical protein SUGI_0399320 [Cryptomeria japonica]|nr:hypothetical protein SUGI_0399320 [Cryptomeria japonica]